MVMDSVNEMKMSKDRETVRAAKNLQPTDSAANLLPLGDKDVTLTRFIHPLLAQLSPTPSPRGGCAQKALNVAEDCQGTCRHSRRDGAGTENTRR